MKKIIAGLGLLLASAAAFAANAGCCMDLECCLRMLGCC